MRITTDRYRHVDLYLLNNNDIQLITTSTLGDEGMCTILTNADAIQIRDFLISLNLDQHVPKPPPSLYQWLGRDGEAVA